MALPVLLLGVLLVEPALAPALPGVDEPPVPVPMPVPDAPLPAGLAAVLPSPVLPAPIPPGGDPVPVALSVPVPVPVPELVPEPVEGPPIPSTELDVPEALAPSLRVSPPMVGVPGAPVPAPGAVEPGGEPMGGVGSVLRSQAVSAIADNAIKGTASHRGAAMPDAFGRLENIEDVEEC